MSIAAVALIPRETDGKFVCVWNQRYDGWGFPGGRVEEGETVEEAVRREVREETGAEVVECKLLWKGPHGIPNPDPTRANWIALCAVKIRGEPRETEEGCPVTHFSREQFLRWSPFAALYARIFDELDEAAACGRAPDGWVSSRP